MREFLRFGPSVHSLEISNDWIWLEVNDDEECLSGRLVVYSLHPLSPKLHVHYAEITFPNRGTPFNADPAVFIPDAVGFFKGLSICSVAAMPR
jgi:hypothetical protein